ncbi:BEL1-like homeodomain protein 1 isoform X2 [Salvia splendens]|uniref:BEL1-like homeodomain protein 1 isoform X2 n=1 Tax=Salvia splendens TaxID=180675 RepID=UPI001C27F8A4|nr:BEL1-like homeodomain protein 1 isoform X2 [Salvia splendens]
MYFHGDTEMQGNGDVLQTLILNQHHHLPPPPSAANFIFLNASQIHYNSGGVPAREVKRGLSLSLSSDEKHAAASERVRVFGVAEKAALSCKYLKAAQQLLDEVVNGRKEAEKGGESGKEDDGKLRDDAEAVAGDGCGKGGAELTTAEKQEIQMKRAKLVDMLHEVEQKYKQYEEQMQKVIKWLEEAAGVGCAKTYTASPLETISKQFRSLKDAIMQQIRRRTTNSGPKMEASTFQINSPWRPQRGLPEKSVCVLRAWLFQHFLHPYPKDSDKVMLAQQAGLTRSQVSNWFINARVRLWKPMVEEMYAEEMKAQQQTPKIEHENEGLVDENASLTINNNDNEGFSLIGSSKMDTEWMRSSKKPRNAQVSSSPSMIVSEVENQHVTTITGTPANFFGLYDPIVGIEQFQQPYSRNGVSLTLGLQHCESLSNQSFISSRSVEASAQGNDFVYY